VLSKPHIRGARSSECAPLSHLSDPVEALETLQGVRYKPETFYKPHHDYYNACETWLDGNRHFTYLVYLNAVEGGGGETGFPLLNLTIPPTPYAALLFDNCLPNGDPDERTLHEGVAPLTGTKYAVNGWMRSKVNRQY
jgi:prolyl 4-hydroxylase